MAEKSVIVVPIDFEQASSKALSVAKALGARLGAEVVLVHVYQIPMFTYPGLEPSLLPTFSGEVATAAKRAVADLVAKEGGGIRAVVREGDPATELLVAAKELGAEMIIMGTHGRKGFAHLFLGSVAEKVMRDSPIPVMTIRGEEPAS